MFNRHCTTYAKDRPQYLYRSREVTYLVTEPANLEKLHVIYDRWWIVSVTLE
jgi:hypothetical protein